MYWPPEMLAQVFPEKYRHLNKPSPFRETEERNEPRYTAQRRGSCTVYWLGRGSKLWPTASTSTDSYAT
jgi:hypothetical protein